jgi:hypothetical protein
MMGVGLIVLADPVELSNNIDHGNWMVLFGVQGLSKKKAARFCGPPFLFLNCDSRALNFGLEIQCLFACLRCGLKPGQFLFEN